MATLEILALGPLRVSLAGQPITDFKSNKARALLAYLAMEAGKYHHRSVLACMFWPELPDQSALTNLRDNLSFLRKLVNDRSVGSKSPSDPARAPYLLITRDTVRFNAESDYFLDAEQFSSQIKSTQSIQEIEKALALVQGELLEGFALRDSSGFEDWLVRKREQINQTVYFALRTVATTYEKQQQYDKALAVATRQLAYIPWTEETYRHLIRLYALNGNYRQALLQYETCKRVLWEEMGVALDPETTALYEQVRNGLLKADNSAASTGDQASQQIFSMQYRPVDRVEKVSRPLIGRKAELYKLHEHLSAAITGSSQFVFVRGDIGSGKTALIHHFCRQAMEAHPELIVAQGEASVNFGYDGAFLPIRELVQGLCETSDARTPCNEISSEQIIRADQFAPAARQMFLQKAPALFHFFVSSDGISSPRNGANLPGVQDWREVASTADPGRGERFPHFSSLLIGPLFEQFSKVLRFLSWQQPLILVLDNLQWADESTMQLLYHFGQRLENARILVICIYRSVDVGTRNNGRRHSLQSLSNELSLKFGDNCLDLDRSDGKLFFHDLLDRDPNTFQPAFRQALFQLSGGNPLLSIELLQDLKDRRIITQDSSGQWSQAQEIAWRQLPPRVEAMLSERITQLDEEHQEYLQVASVQQEQIFPAVVASVLQKDRKHVEQAFHDLLSKKYGLVRAVGNERLGNFYATYYCFSPDIYRVFLSNGMDEVERNFLTGRMAPVMEALTRGEKTFAMPA